MPAVVQSSPAATRALGKILWQVAVTPSSTLRHHTAPPTHRRVRRVLRRGQSGRYLYHYAFAMISDSVFCSGWLSTRQN